MRKLTLLAAAAMCAAIGFSSAANATVVLLNGDNSLPSTAMVHLDAGFDNSDVGTVHGVTSAGLQVLFTGNVNIDGTSGSGYAQINDSDSAGVFNTLTITPGNFLGFSDYELSIMYDGSNANPIYLTIAYTLLGGGGGSFVFDPLAANNTPLNNLRYTNNGNRDFRLDTTAGETITSIVLSGRLGTLPTDTLAPILQEKQNDVIGVQQAVPEPATWAMMLIGFGGIGMTMRRGRKADGKLPQLA
jgi:PEP-CTERM motif